ncbi:MAG: T9SS type A sorting domain-containing protein [candidate division WOR-3 bacterium]
MTSDMPSVIRLYDVQGRLTKKWNLTRAGRNRIDVKDLFPGVYTIIASDGNVKFTEKLVVVH